MTAAGSPLLTVSPPGTLLTALSPEGLAGLVRCPRCGRRRAIERLDRTFLHCLDCECVWDPKKEKKR